jgi:integrase
LGLTLEEEERLLAASPPWLQQLIVFAVSTGLRHREVLHLQWPEVDFSRKTITILEQKNKSIDTLPLNVRALDVLKERAKVRHLTSKYVFFTATGNAILINNVLRGLYSAIEKANIGHLRFHDLRHTFATRLVQAGVDLYTVQKLGRWKTLSMVMRYAHHHSESLRAGTEVLDRVTRRENTTAAQLHTGELAAVC